jgi:hypothetical protein
VVRLGDDADGVVSDDDDDDELFSLIALYVAALRRAKEVTGCGLHPLPFRHLETTRPTGASPRHDWPQNELVPSCHDRPCRTPNPSASALSAGSLEHRSGRESLVQALV